MALTPSFHLILIAVLVATASLSLSPASAAKCHREDKKALLAIKRFWNNPSHLSSWVPSTGCCDWSGVSCDYVTGSVTNLAISDDANIRGTMPPSIGDLPHLTQLDIHNLTHLTGPIPSALSRLRKLTYLRLDQNDLTGPIPPFIGQFSELWYLNLGYNRLTGSIPRAIGELAKLTYLMLDRNRLNGPIPAEFGKLSAGTVLMLSHNKLSGALPPALGAVDFAAIHLSNNRLSGDATFLFGQHKKELSYVDLSRNLFEFDLSPVLFPTWPQLHAILLSHNRIYGRIPKQIGELGDLESLDVSYNRLCGEIPTGGNFDGFKAEVYAHNQCLCGKPLPRCE